MAKQKAPAKDVREQVAVLRGKTGWTPSEIITLLRGGGASAKGGQYERDICKKFSLWWTGGARDDVFWRTAGSGARAKVRGRAGAATAGQHGDIAATDPIGAPLIETFTIEIKRGYSEHTLQDIIDRPLNGGLQEWERWFIQAVESSEQAGSLTWALVTRRDRRAPLVWVPWYITKKLRGLGAWPHGWPCPMVISQLTIKGFDDIIVAGMCLDDWLAGVWPEHIKELPT